MAKVYFITGTLGGGKSLCAVDMIKKYLVSGRKVATNINLNLEYICSPDNKHSRVIRVPDSPTIDDLRAIGYGSQEQDPETHGLLVLDELGTWFNARDFANKERLKIIKWMIHMRKRRWDVAFLVQDFSMVDKQARGNIAQHLVTCRSSKQFYLFKFLPKFHIANVLHLSTKTSAGNWYYKGVDVYPAYDTEQLFYTTDDDSTFVDADSDMSFAERRYRELNGLYSVLPTGYLSDKQKAISLNHINAQNKKNLYSLFVYLPIFIFLIYFIFMNLSDDPSVNAEMSLNQLTDTLPDSNLEVTIEPDFVTDPSLVFQGFYILTHSRIGQNYNYTLTDGARRISTRDISSSGYKVVPRGDTEVLIVDEKYQFSSIKAL